LRIYSSEQKVADFSPGAFSAQKHSTSKQVTLIDAPSSNLLESRQIVLKSFKMARQSRLELVKADYMKITEFYTNGTTNAAKVSQMTNIPERTVCRHIESWKRGTPVEEIKCQGRLSRIVHSIHSYMGSKLHRNPQASSKDIAGSISVVKNGDVMPRTVRRHLATMGYKNSAPKVVPLLTPLQLERRTSWCHAHSNFDWSSVVFTDETCIETGGSRLARWHKKGTFLICPKPKHPPKMMFWAAISVNN
jgi:hypothetical protein